MRHLDLSNPTPAPRSLRICAMAAVAVLLALGATSAAAAQSKAAQVAQMHRQEMIAFEAGVGGVTREHGLPTGQALVTQIVSDQPSLRGIVTAAHVGTRGHIGVGQSTPSLFLAVGRTVDGTLVTYRMAAPRGLDLAALPAG